MHQPTLDETSAALLALFPEGEAWQNGDMVLGHDKTVMRRLIRALAVMFNRVEREIVSTFAEMFVSSASADIDLWQEEYGLPDDCDPFGDDVVAKATTLGVTSIVEYELIASKFGYTTTIRALKGDDVEFPGVVSTLHVTIDSAESPGLWPPPRVGIATVGAPSDILWPSPRVGTSAVGSHLGGVANLGSHLGAPDLSLLTCKLERIIPAHVEITYSVI